MLNFDEFLNLFNLTLIDFDNYYGDQCVDLIQFWARNLGYPRFMGDAYQIIDEAGNNYTKILNTPTDVPQKGDIIVWGTSYNGTVGHVGICTGRADINTFDAFVQNDPFNSNCHVKTYNYNSVVGWLRPNQLPADTQAELNQCRVDRDQHYNDLQAEKAKTIDLQNQLTACLNKPPENPTPPSTTPIDPNSSIEQQLTVCKNDLQTTSTLSQFRFNVLTQIKQIVNSQSWWWTKVAQVKSVLNKANI